MERQPRRFAHQGYSSPYKWNRQFFNKAQARSSICPNSTECAEKLELGFVYCHVLRAATFVQIRSEDGGGKKPTPLLISYSTVCFFSATSWPADYKVSYRDWCISCDVNVLYLLFSVLVFHWVKEANTVNWPRRIA